MKKNIFTLLLVLVVSTALSTTVMAAGETISGFYDIGTSQNVTLSPCAGDTQVSATKTNVDSDSNVEMIYLNSDNVGIEYQDAVEGGYYGIMLVEGSGLPTKDTQIHYMNQEKAGDTDVTFNIKTSSIKETTEMTLYITSNAEGFEMVNIPMSYAVNEIIRHIPGDVNGDYSINADDIIRTRRFITGGWGISIITAAADVDADGKHSARDVILIRRFVAGGYGVVLK